MSTLELLPACDGTPDMHRGFKRFLPGSTFPKSMLLLSRNAGPNPAVNRTRRSLSMFNEEAP
jgi:hypothetical protein